MWWLLLGLVAGAAGVVALSVYWERIKNWLQSISSRLNSWSKLYIRKLNSTQSIMTIESETRIVNESEVPEEIRTRSYSNIDVTTKAKQLGVLQV